MLERPCLKQHFAIEIVNDDLVFLLSEHKHHVLQGVGYGPLVELLDGQYTSADILEALGSTVPIANLLGALERLERQGLLFDVESSAAKHPPLWDALDLSPSALQPALQRTLLNVVTVGELDADEVVASFRGVAEGSGLQLGSPGMQIVFTDSYERPELQEINRLHLERGFPWMLARCTGLEIWLGPIFVPHQTGCLQCLLSRYQRNRQLSYWLDQRRGNTVIRAAKAAGTRKFGYRNIHGRAGAGAVFRAR